MYDDGHIVSRLVWYGPVECLYMYIWWCLYILYASPLALPDFYKHIYAQTRGEKKKSSATGSRTRDSTVTGLNTNRYTIADVCWKDME